MRKFRRISLLIAATLVFGSGAEACGPWLPNRLLDSGGKIILAAPEFYFELELKEIAKDYPTSFLAADHKPEESAKSTTVLADIEDFKESGKPDLALHEAMRRYLTGGLSADPAPAFRAENDEFSLYHRGALALKQQRPEESRVAWQSLLELPLEQRSYRSTWAAFMLGKMNLSTDPAAAKMWFQKTRALISEGCKDSLGLASESLGWEARCELDAQQLERAAPLYMQQLASGDLTAVDSAKQLSGDFYPADQLPRFAADPLLRRITSAHVLGISTQGYSNNDSNLTAWLASLEKTTTTVAEADRLGWLAYTAGRYDEAARWLKKVPAPTSLSLWLKAKLDFRAGKIADAKEAMSESIQKMARPQTLKTYELNPDQVMPDTVAVGDLGLLQLARSEFAVALQTFLDGDHWQDAAYVAERVLSIQELTDHLAKNFPWTEAQDDFVKLGEYGQNEVPDGAENTFKLRWLLARRLARLEKFADARPYFPKPLRPVLDGYVSALQNKEKGHRATSLWQAAQIARDKGMELFGTENEPDAFLWDGQFEQSNVAQERETGKYTATDYTAEREKKFTQPLILPSTKIERQRLTLSHVEPEKRFHYRYHAANLAWQAAKLMPDQVEQTALVLNTAGSWLKNRDEAAADRFLQAIERRCDKTLIGQEVLKKHWFIDSPNE